MSERRGDWEVSVESELAETPADRVERAIVLPVPLEELARPAFPWLMMLTPVALGVGLVVMTGSTYALLFAGLGPVLALATVIDQSAQRRARYRREDARFERDLEDARAAIESRVARERARRIAKHPPLDALLGRPAALVQASASDPGSGTAGGLTGGTAGGPSGAVSVAVGTTSVPSGIRVETHASHADRRLQELEERASRLPAIPLVARARRCAIIGRLPHAVSAALGMVVDLASRAPNGFALQLDESAGGRAVTAEILRAGLHECGAVHLAAAESSEGGEPSVEAERAPAFELIVAERRGEIATAPDLLLEVQSARLGLVHADGEVTRVTPQLPSVAAFRSWAREHAAWRSQRSAATAMGLPDDCDLDDIVRCAPPEHARTGSDHLAAPIGAGPRGVEWVDLIRDGPHAIVGGTTGTGKSELLRGWVGALATRYPASHVTFLCIDFKGGATFDAIAELPHCLGVVTDLDAGEAVRVLAGLRAELRRREHILREHRSRDIAGLAPGVLARLVVVVDEFQALIDAHQELYDAFSDLAARGRSLGIHLILCAQRPAGAVRDALLANCNIRFCLRVTSTAESTAVIGGPQAATIPAERKGRAYMTFGEAPRLIQVARVGDALLDATTRRRRRELGRHADARPTAPWLPPLPRRLALHDELLPQPERPHAIAVGLIDDPDQQRQFALELDLRGGGHLLVIGPSGSGKTTALTAIAEAIGSRSHALKWIPRCAEGAWDVVHALRTGDEACAIVIDDLDDRGALFDEEHRHAWLAALSDLARLGSARGVTIVASATRASGEIGQFVGLARDVVRLGSPARHEFVLAGGEAADYRAGLPPGRGVVGGLLVQMPVPSAASVGGGADGAPAAIAAAAAEPEPLELERLAARHGAVVTRRPGSRAAQLQGAGIDVSGVPRPGAAACAVDGTGAAHVTVGDPDSWQQSFGSLARHAARSPIVFDGAAPHVIRSLLPGEGLPPPVADRQGVVLIREPSGSYRRARWPAQP